MTQGDTFHILAMIAKTPSLHSGVKRERINQCAACLCLGSLSGVMKFSDLKL
jgi:hypothetical protein